MTTFEPRTFGVERFRAPDAPAPTATDPQTHGDIWKVWRIERTPEIDVLYGTMTPGTRTGAHIHPDTMHYTCILEGAALVWIEGTMVELRAGDTLNIPRFTLHNFGASRGERLWWIDITTPAWDPEKLIFEPEREDEIAAAFAQAWGEGPG
ncbi:MAG TPA: cupin domain-containing protein [Acidimicrobiales bacterium]|jgi:mannose-6-phosphate isomerase-like protein (cupin superfamily)|nr:cupin domain-containing protein [Acidimicrobiales bacterium]